MNRLQDGTKVQIGSRLGTIRGYRTNVLARGSEEYLVMPDMTNSSEVSCANCGELHNPA